MYYLATDKESVFHYGEIQENQEISTGQPFLEYFETKEELRDRMNELGQVFIETKTINQSGL